MTIVTMPMRASVTHTRRKSGGKTIAHLAHIGGSLAHDLKGLHRFVGDTTRRLYGAGLIKAKVREPGTEDPSLLKANTPAMELPEHPDLS